MGLWAQLTAAATNVVAAAANMLAISPWNAPSKLGARQMVGAIKGGCLLPECPTGSKRNCADRGGDKQESLRKKKKPRKSSAAAAGQMDSSRDGTEVVMEKHVQLEPQVEVGREEERPLNPHEENTNVLEDVPSTSQNGPPSEPGPSAPLASAVGTTLEYDDVMSRVKPAHARFAWGPSRAVCVTKRRKPAFAYAAKLQHLSPETQADLARFHSWLTNPPATWHGRKNGEESAAKIVERIRGMLGWLTSVAKRADVADVRLQNLVPSADVGGAVLVHEYVNWLGAERAAVEATLQLVYRSLLHLAMYLHHTASKALPVRGQAPYDDVPVIAELRSYSGMLQRKAKKAPKVADEKAKRVAWPDFVGVLLKELRAECAGQYKKGSYRSHSAVAKSVQKYLIAAILACGGDRQRTIRDLEVGETLVQMDGRWVICLEPKDHKTGGAGAERPKIPLPALVSADLDTFLHTWRKYLDPGHDFVFCSATGQRLEASGLCQMFGETVHRILGKKMNPHLVRAAMVTHFRAGGATDREMEALALCMGHSVAVQRTTYDQRSVDEKAAPALDMVEGAFEKLMCCS